MTVLLLAYYYAPQNTSGVQRAMRLAKYLPRSGYPTFVICSGPGSADDTGTVIHVPNDRTIEPSLAATAEVASEMQKMLPHFTALSWAPHAVAAAEMVAREHEVAAVISTSPPVGSHFAALWIKKRYGIKWIADFRDPLFGNPGRPLLMAHQDIALERLIFSSADCVTTVTDVIAAEWKTRYPQIADRFRVIWNGFDPEEAIGPARPPDGVKKVLAHVGIVAYQRDPTAVLSSLTRLIDQGRVEARRILVRFVGETHSPSLTLHNPAVRALAGRRCIQADGKLVPRLTALEEIASADYLLLLDQPNAFGSGYAVPAKLFDYVRVGRPILAVTQKESPVDRLLAKSGVPSVCIYDSDSEVEIDGKLHGFLNLSAGPVYPSEEFLAAFDGKRQAEQFISILEDLQRGS